MTPIIYMNENSQNMFGLFEKMDLTEALIKQVNERVFQLQGYVDLIKECELSEENKEYLLGMKDVISKLSEEIRFIIDHYRPTNSL